MKIGPTPPPTATAALQPTALAPRDAQALARSLAEARPAGPRRGEPAGTAEAGTTVHLSAAAQMLANAAGEGMDLAKVESLRQQIADGRYQADAGAIADKLLAETMAQLGLPPR